jgi:hypothetical protein
MVTPLRLRHCAARDATPNHGAFAADTRFPWRMGATMEDDMVADLADTALWTILAIAVAFVAFGCLMTKPKPKIVQQSSEGTLDRAA